jgi:hypothetical protein
LVQDTPRQFDPQSTHSITIPDKVELPLEMHGVISHLRTRKPTAEEIERYTNGLFQSAVLTDDVPWEPYSEKFMAAETNARVARAAIVPRAPSIPRMMEAASMQTHTSEVEEENSTPQRSPILTQHCVAVASRLFQSQDAIELSHEDDLAVRLIAAINIEADAMSGDGLYERPENPLCELSDSDRLIFAMSTKERGSVITKEILAKRWGIGLDTAHRTLTSTTQSGVRRVLQPLERRFKTKQSHLRFPTLNSKFYTDTMFSTTKSIRGNKCAQVFTNGLGYDLFYPLKKESEVGDALNEMIRSVGIPKELVSDGARAETAGRFADVAKREPGQASDDRSL